MPTISAPRTFRSLAIGLAIAASVTSCAAPVETAAAPPMPSVAAADVGVSDLGVTEFEPDYPEEYSEPAVFYDPWLALRHSGPWADHQLGRCLDWPRTTGALYTDIQVGGGLGADGPLESYVAQSATFADDATAEAAFNDIDWCYITGSIVQFAEALGWYGYDAAFSSNEWIENVDGEQTLFVEFDHWDLPITLVAIQRDRQVSVAISYDGWPEGTYLEAADLLA